ncbi:hypothetical protein FNV43_RR22510 [Rhamnella rubrinervis]|uniref:U-box domain-containing protein n=1 Tax=Rhamnella rubrinervis TaxID=2594499 RepID=A0A8K0DVD1_9ROSA|nr:hypothetical protein FNV43_RR22510 [Rhamnella rubrinervis]
MPGSLEPLDLGVQIPYHFRCPISLELMHDPVTVSTGQTYDRPSIESWVATGNTTCPVTRAPLTDFTLIPNHTLRRLIQEWCVANQSFGIERIPTPKQPADPAMVRSLLAQASFESSPPSSRLTALRRLRGLARDSDKNRSVISSHNVSEILLEIVFSDTGSDSSELSHEALALVVMFPFTESQCTTVSSDPDRKSWWPGLESRLRAQISNVDEIFEGVIEILRNPIAYPRALKVGIKALFALCLVKQTRHKAVSAGAAETLIDRLADFEKCDAESSGHRRAPLPDPGGLRSVRRTCTDGASVGEDNTEDIRQGDRIRGRSTDVTVLGVGGESEGGGGGGVLTQLLLLVQSDCTDRAKRKAQLLLKLLRDSWPQDSLTNSDDFACSEVVVPF